MCTGVIMNRTASSASLSSPLSRIYPSCGVIPQKSQAPARPPVLLLGPAQSCPIQPCPLRSHPCLCPITGYFCLCSYTSLLIPLVICSLSLLLRLSSLLTPFFVSLYLSSVPWAKILPCNRYTIYLFA